MNFWCLQMSQETNMKLGQKSVKSLVGFLGDLKTLKFHSEINWPLVITILLISAFFNHEIERNLQEIPLKIDAAVSKTEWRTSGEIIKKATQGKFPLGFEFYLWDACLVHGIWTEHWMTNLVFDVCFDFFSRHEKQIWK